MSEFFADIEIIPLETNELSVIGKSGKLIQYGDTIYILDTEQAALFLFGKDGAFIDKISNPGNGPGEYSLLYDFEINRFTGNIELLDPRGKIIIYSPNLDFIRSIHLPVRAVHNFFYLNPDTIILHSEYENERLSFFSIKENRIIKSAFSFTEEAQNMPSRGSTHSSFQFTLGKVLFSIPYSNSIYEISGTDLILRKEWDFGKYNFSFDDLEKNLSDFQKANQFLSLKDKVYSFYYYLENENYIFTRFIFKKEWIHLIVDKKMEKYYLLNRFEDGLYPPIIRSISNNEVISINEPHTLSEYVSKNVLSDQQVKILETIRADDNPVIIKYKLRHNDSE